LKHCILIVAAGVVSLLVFVGLDIRGETEKRIQRVLTGRQITLATIPVRDRCSILKLKTSIISPHKLTGEENKGAYW
jgi:hypothetical protein